VFTTAGHLRQEQQGLRSTKPSQPINVPVTKTNDVICSLLSSQDKAFMDLTGRFPIRSSRGNEYILIAYHYDSNAILGEPIKNRQAATITSAWLKIHNKLTNSGQKPNLWILDNETSAELRSTMSKNAHPSNLYHRTTIVPMHLTIVPMHLNGQSKRLRIILRLA